MRHVIVTVTYDTEHNVQYVRRSNEFATSRSVATKIVETVCDIATVLAQRKEPMAFVSTDKAPAPEGDQVPSRDAPPKSKIRFGIGPANYADTEEEKEEAEGKATLIIAKQRNGPVGNVPLAFLKEFTRFEDRAREQEE